MWVILLEALAALLIGVFIVWWTMFSGRRGGERRQPSSSRLEAPLHRGPDSADGPGPRTAPESPDPAAVRDGRAPPPGAAGRG